MLTGKQVHLLLHVQRIAFHHLFCGWLLTSLIVTNQSQQSLALLADVNVLEFASQIGVLRKLETFRSTRHFFVALVWRFSVSFFADLCVSSFALSRMGFIVIFSVSLSSCFITKSTFFSSFSLWLNTNCGHILFASRAYQQLTCVLLPLMMKENFSYFGEFSFAFLRVFLSFSVV